MDLTANYLIIIIKKTVFTLPNSVWKSYQMLGSTRGWGHYIKQYSLRSEDISIGLVFDFNFKVIPKVVSLENDFFCLSWRLLAFVGADSRYMTFYKTSHCRLATYMQDYFALLWWTQNVLHKGCFTLIASCWSSINGKQAFSTDLISGRMA